MLRGPVKLEFETFGGEPFWNNINIPIPTKRTRQRQKTLAVIRSGVLSDNVKNFNRISEKSTPILDNFHVKITPICLSFDAMAIKASGDIDNASNTIVWLTEPIDMDFIKANLNPSQTSLKVKCTRKLAP